MALRCGALALLCLGLLVASAGTAMAEVGYPTPTVQAVAADATWLAYTPPPEHPGIVCMVDSGVDPNPDTEAAVIGGQALAPETETNDEIARLEPKTQPGNHPNGHGTLMAMMMAAPINGWGMVGIAPTSVRVYNMKALPKGETTFPFDYYSVAIEDCNRLHSQTYSFLSVINLSLGGESAPGSSEIVGLENYVVAAQQLGIGVVAAAGNEGGSVLYPAAYPTVFAVGAGDAGSGPGALCSFASRGEGLDLLAPGCDGQTQGLEGAFEDDGSPAFGSGSSQASAIVSAVLASMRAYNPQLTLTQAETCLLSTAKSDSIDVAAAFDSCGLSQIVSQGQASEEAASGQQSTGSESSSTSDQVISITSQATTPSGCAGANFCPYLPTSESVTPRGFESKSTCPRPQDPRVVNIHKHLVLQTRERPSGCRLQARYRVRQDHQTRWKLSRSVLANKLLVSTQDFQVLQARNASGSSSRASSRWVAVDRGMTLQ